MNKNYLKPEKYQEIGAVLLETVNELELIQETLDFIPGPDNERVEKNLVLHYTKVHRIAEILFSKVQYMQEDLNGVIPILFHTNDLKGLENLLDGKHLTADDIHDAANNTR